ncbi:MAG: hypothetical protein ACK5S2_04700 [Lysobacteraceae bacterium]|jgi:hypothetical protein|nr:hypothetical protein [Xanthomonadaceae bacterium]MCZ8317398.1 hypothetical protein [Silanimonas sp.]
MDPSTALPPIATHEISIRGRIDPKSSWHAAERRVAALVRDGITTAAPSWASLVEALGGSLQLANRRAAELAPTVAAVNRIIAALNALPSDSCYEDLEVALGLATPKPLPASHDRIGEAMSRVLQSLEARRLGDRGGLHALG